jgi:Zn-dependent peptidase ImmA (M78 family)/DNA-binding XRE family transcriptional regulator
MGALERQDPVALGELLRNARTAAGLTQEQAAKRLDLARTTLVALEKGQRRVRPVELRAITKLYGVTANSLLRSSSIHVDIVPRFRALADGATQGEVDAARLLNDLAAAELEIERLLGQRLVRNYPHERQILPGDIKEQAEDAAMEQRHRLGLGLSPIADLVSLLELEVGMRIFIRPLQSSISGLFVFDEAVGACVLLNRNHPRERRTLTLAHEYGHLLSSRSSPEITNLSVASQSREERFATAFALAFVMPAALVRRRFHEAKQQEKKFSPRHLIMMAHSFNVSNEAICKRLEDLKLLPDGTWDSLRTRGFSGDLVRAVLGDSVKDEPLLVPPRLWMLSAEAYRKGLFTEAQLSKLLRMEIVEVRGMLDTLDLEDEHDLESISTN